MKLSPGSLRFVLSIVIGILTACASSVGFAQLAWPEVRQETKPWTRWWWLGNSVSEADLTSMMEQYVAVGLGGLELTPIYGVRGEEKRFAPFLGQTFMQRFEHTLREGRRLGLGVDLSTGTGWPFGGPWIGEQDSAKYLAHREFKVAAGKTLSEVLSFRQKSVVRYAGPKRTPLSEIKQPLTANADLQELALDQVRFDVPLPLVALRAFGPAGEVVDLTKRVKKDGRLDWTAPSGAGEWRVYALYQGWHGKMVERAGPGGEGFAIDHFSVEALRRYLEPFDAAFKNRDLSGLRGYFNDSYEVDDASGEANWTPLFLEEFQRRRGYDLLDQLPALFAEKPDEKTYRVRTDYRETISDLMLDRFTMPWREWAHRQGKIIRNQAHGSPALLLDLYAASDIPEQEGDDILAIKLASSAAHVTGKPLASAEAATWLGEHWSSTLGDVKTCVDLFFLAGINHVCYHGTACSPAADPWPGHQFYAAVELHPENPMWRDFPALNAYVARAQSFLQAGLPDEDLLVYYNIHDRWARAGEEGRSSMPHFHGREREGVGARIVAEALTRRGYGLDYISDRMIARLTVDASGMLRYTDGSASGAAWRALVIPLTQYMPDATWSKLVTLAEDGATIVVEGKLPADVPGLGRLEERRIALGKGVDQVRKALKSISSGDTDQVASIGRGNVWHGARAIDLVAKAGIPREQLSGAGLGWVRRAQQNGGYDYFLINRSAEALSAWMPVLAKGKGAAWFDPMSGKTGVAEHRLSPAGVLEVWMHLEPGESRVLRVATSSITGEKWPRWIQKGEPVEVSGTWAVTFTKGGPAMPKPSKQKELKSWTEWSGAEMRSFSGTASYRIDVPAPSGVLDAVALDLGRVAESARVRWNGVEEAVLITPPFRIVLPKSVLKEHNVLEVEVTNLAANRIADYDRRGVPWKKFYNTNMPPKQRENRGPDGLFSAAKWEPRESGLIGPVKLQPLVLFENGQN